MQGLTPAISLNLTLPLVQPQGRAGLTATFALSYNSQIWSGTGPLGKDVGFGCGWKLMAGSIAARAGGGYVYTDASGAEYSLTAGAGGVWTSKEGVYVSYDAGTNRLSFPSGTFRVIGSVAAAGRRTRGRAIRRCSKTGTRWWCTTSRGRGERARTRARASRRSRTRGR